MHSGTSFLLVTACHAQPTNQRRGKQCVGIFADNGVLCGHKTKFFLFSGVETDQRAECLLRAVPIPT